MSKEQTVKEARKLRILLDTLHGEEQYTYDKLIKILSERCEVTIQKKKPLNLATLAENNVFLLISPGKSWDESEIETIQGYVGNEGGILIAMTIDGRKPEHLNKLLSPFGISVVPGTVADKYIDKDSLETSALLENVRSLALGEVWGRRSTGISISNEAEVVVQFRDSVLAVRRPFGKGAVYLFSCLPVFGNRQLDESDNRRFLDNLLESLATPEMTGTLQAIASDRALAAEEILDAIQPDTSNLLFFTTNRIILAKLGGASILGKVVGAGLGGVIGLGIADGIARDKRMEKLRQLSPDKILIENKRNFTIPYDNLQRFELCRGKGLWAFRGVRIETVSNKYEFQCTSEEFRDKVDSIVERLRPILAGKLFLKD